MNFEKMLLSHPDGMAIFDVGMNIIFVNPSMEAIAGKNLSARAAGSVFAPDSEISMRVSSFFSARETYTNHDYMLTTPDGTATHLMVSVTGIDYGGQTNGAAVIFRKTGHKNELSDELDKEKKIGSLSLMAAGLAHEIKNPLSGIRGTAQLIGNKDPKFREYSDIIVNETDRINALVSDLLNLGGARKPVMKKVNVHLVLDETIALLEPQFRKKGIGITRDYDPSLPEITADFDRLKQVFINLAKNGFEEMAKGGMLRVRTRTSFDLAPMNETSAARKKTSMMAVDFVDTGKGIPEEIGKNLFTPFNTGKRKGTGLGLVVSLKIVKDHGGTLTLENNKPGPGATARVTIPLQ